MISKNIKILRNHSGLNQTAFGSLFKITRGMIDSYERGISKPSTDLIKRMADHYNLSIEILQTKDLSVNPGLMFAGAAVNNLKGTVADDLLRAKDDLIRELKGQIKYLQILNEQLLQKLGNNNP